MRTQNIKVPFAENPALPKVLPCKLEKNKVKLTAKIDRIKHILETVCDLRS